MQLPLHDLNIPFLFATAEPFMCVYVTLQLQYDHYRKKQWVGDYLNTNTIIWTGKESLHKVALQLRHMCPRCKRRWLYSVTQSH
ncbi:hypothetical protein XENTR_v10015147 [Xenopus tropicalis]|nr:hypothetical protein XENTR_v10015147 [Xenopus tropicalis]